MEEVSQAAQEQLEKELDDLVTGQVRSKDSVQFANWAEVPAADANRTIMATNGFARFENMIALR